MVRAKPRLPPSRATIVTGRYPRHHGVKWNFSDLNENELTLVEFFKRQGYRTATVGKHHVDQKRFLAALDHAEANEIRNLKPDNPFIQYVKSRGYTYRTAETLPRMKNNSAPCPPTSPKIVTWTRTSGSGRWST